MNTSDLIKKCGSVAAAMTEFRVSRQLWYHWHKHGIPAGRQAQIQIATKGRLKAGERGA